MEKKDVGRKRGKKLPFLLYIGTVIGLCLLPLAAMGIRPTDSLAENKVPAKIPALREENGWNLDFLADAGAYFQDHFACRQELVAADAKLRAGVFGVSAADNVILGDNGWLYYAATLDDYQHKNGVSDRMLFNMAHNTALMQEYTELLGKTFVFTIAPNKNSLYGENMPGRYRYTVSPQSDAQRFVSWLEKEGVHYVDLFALFAGQEETLYYARDSHWNQKGAVLVYNALLDACGIPHETYREVPYETACTYVGDLNRMLYPVWAKPEDEVYFQKAFTYEYGKEGATVEDTLVETFCSGKEKNLLMYRDSFGNSLLPYMAEQFAKATFSKVVPYPMTDLVNAEPDVVIVEKVERHLPTLGEVPPQMRAPVRTLATQAVPAEGSASLQAKKEGGYIKLTGVADASCVDKESRFYAEVTGGGQTAVYEAFCVRLDENGTSSDYGFLLYLSQLQITGEELQVSVIGEKDGGYVKLCRETVALP